MSNLQSYFFELKWRLFYILLSLISTFLVSYNFQLEIVYIIGKPFLEYQQTFVFFELTEAFYTLLRIATILTLFVNIPFVIYHIWSFFVPSLYRIERSDTNYLCIVFFGLFVIEILFSYFFLLPQICNFLLSFEMTSGGENSGLHLTPLLSIEFTARIQSYVELLVKIFSSSLILFQLPICVYYLYSKKILHVSSFYINRKILCLISLLLSAFIVPPDILSQLVLTLFFFFLFEMLIFIGLFFE